MKTMFAALLLSTLAGPVLALNIVPVASSGVTSSELLIPSGDEFGRRSGRCANRPVMEKTRDYLVTREGSACGGV